MRRIIFGGSFDPIHFGHVKMAKAALESVNADVVEFVIAPTSRWKKYNSASSHRLEMTRLMVSDLPWAKVSDIEVKRNSPINYTFDTLGEYRAMYPDDELFLLIGADQAFHFPKWFNPLDISKMAKILVYKRDNIKIPKKIITTYNMTLLEGDNLPYSSTDIRNLVNLGTKEEVLTYIEENNLYYMKKVSALISEKRLKHSLEVARLARKIAKSNDLDIDAAYVAGLLHDIGKEVDNEKAKVIMEAHYSEYKDLYRWLHHQFIGAYLAKTKFKVKNQDILKAIEFHATGNKDMSPLGMVIYSADKIEPTRGFDSSDLIAGCLENYYTGFIEVLRANREFLMSKNYDIENPLTKACMDFYLK